MSRARHQDFRLFYHHGRLPSGKSWEEWELCEWHVGYWRTLTVTRSALSAAHFLIYEQYHRQRYLLTRYSREQVNEALVA